MSSILFIFLFHIGYDYNAGGKGSLLVDLYMFFVVSKETFLGALGFYNA